MALTIGDWVIVGIVFVIAFVASIALAVESENTIITIVSIIMAFVITFGVAAGLSWYNTSTASGQRSYKDFRSNMDGGIEREIIITAEDGREIFRYDGKVDVESNHTDNYIKFESEEGKRYIIYYGITDTILIREK